MGSTYTRQSSYTDGDVIQAADTNNEFDQLLAAFASSTGHTHDGTAAEGGPITKLLGNTLTFGAATAGTDITITFDGETNDGVLKWMEDEDYFEFSDDILIASTEKLQFRDTAIYLNSSTDGQLDIVADTLVQVATAAFTVDASGDITLDAGGADVVLKDDGTQYGALTNTSGNLIIKSGTTTAMTFSGANVTFAGTVTIGSAEISEAELEILDGATVTTTELNIMDGDTSATSTTVADADRVVFNDAGTMKQVAVTDLAAYFDDEITAMPNLVTTAATTVGALNSGSITSGFGTIDTGSSTITTTGLISGGSLDIDDVLINGTTIGHTDDTDLITLANGVVTVAGEVSMTTLDIGGTNVTSTAAELNIVDGGTSATSTTVADADRVVMNDNGTMVQVAVTDLAAYFDDEITAMPNLVTTAATTVGALDSGSITSGFGTIDTGSSTITTTGAITGGSLVVDNITIDGNTISSTNTNGDLELTPNGTGNLKVNSDTLAVVAAEGEASAITLQADEADDNADIWRIVSNTDNTFAIQNQISGSAVSHLTITPNATVANSTFAVAGGLTTGGTVTANAGVVVDNITIDGTTVALSSGDLTLDVAGELIIDTDLQGTGNGVILKDDGTAFGSFFRSSSNFHIKSEASDKDMIFMGNDEGVEITALTLDMSDSGTAIFNHDISLGDDQFIFLGAGQDMTLRGDGTNGIITSPNGNITLDVAGAIELDSDTGVIDFDDDTLNFGRIENSSSNFKLEARVQDKDIIFTGNDGGVGITALTLDMSAAGKATFSSDVLIPRYLEHAGDSDTFIGFSAADTFDITVGAVEVAEFTASEVVINEDSADVDFRVESNNSDKMFVVDAGSDFVSISGANGLSEVLNSGTASVNSVSANAALEINTRSATNGHSGIINFIKAPNTSGTPTATADGEFLGRASFIGFDTGNTLRVGAQILAVQSGTDSDSVPTRLILNTSSGSSDPVSRFEISTAETIVNEDDNDVDFRVESVSTTHMLFVDAGNEAVIIGDNNRSTSDSGLSVVGSVIDNISIQYKGTTGGHNSKLSFVDKRDQVNAIVQNNLINDGSGTAGAHLEFKTAVSGTLSNRLRLGGGTTLEASFNDDGLNYDFRIESENNANMFHVDANEDAIGIGIAGQSTVGLYVDKGSSAHAAVFRVDSAGFASIICDNQANSGTRNFISFRIDNSAVGSITSTGSATAYNTSSDYRLKENVDYTWDATTRLKQLKPCRFNWIADTDVTVDGFLAHEAQEVVPEAITGTKDEVDDDGNAVMQGIDQSKLVPLLVKTIQELEARITALENS